MNTVKTYESILEGHSATLVLPNFLAAIYGISQISQDNTGFIRVVDSNNREYALPDLDLDILEYHKNDTVLALVAELMPRCNTSALV